MSDDNHSTVQRTIVNFLARFEREITEIKELLLRILTSKNKEEIFKEMYEKLGLIYKGLGVIRDEKRLEGVSAGELAKIELLQKHVLKIKLSLETETIPILIALLESLEQRINNVLGNPRHYKNL